MLRAFLRAPSGVIGLAVLALLLLVAIFAPPLLGSAAAQLNVVDASQNPSHAHLMGTDQLGRDILLRVIVATRLSIGLSLAAAGLGGIIGTVMGSAAAVLPPAGRTVALRAIDTMLAFPAILIAIFIGAIVGPGALGAALGVGIAISFSFARVASALSLSVGGREYIAAARVIGVGRVRLMARYVLPNIAETLAINTTVAVSSSIVAVSSLSFLGLGVQAPDYDWGRMLTEGVQAIYVNPAAAIAPATAIAISALAFGFTGEAIARAMNPVLWAQTRGPAAAHRNGLVPAGQARTDDGPLGQGPAALEVQNLVVSFPGHNGSRVRVVDGVSFRIEKGQVLGVVGESGSGKTMTAMAIAQLVPYPGTVEGVIRLEGEDLENLPTDQLDHLLGTRTAVVFQDPMSSLNPALRIGPQMTEATQTHRHLSHRQATELATTRLREVNIPTAERQLQRHPHELSGGMRQRVMIAMGLMNDPALVIADEPTTALDVTIQAQIMDLVWRINGEHGTAIMLISHNLGLISQNCHRVIVMYAGRVVEELSADQLLTAPLHPYTVALLGAVPDMARSRDEALESIPGQAPDVANLPSGCPFHPRCPRAVDRCTSERPPLLLRPGSGHRVACWVANEDL